MQQRYAKEGLVCLSVSVDDAGGRADALAFLTRQKSTLANYWLDEKDEFWKDKLNVKAPPAVFVFDRRGYRAAKFDTDRGREFTPGDVEKLVKELLRQAP
jgi:hypothetical protein